MKKLLFGLILFVLILLTSCSNDVSGGGDDFPNSMVAGVVVDSDGSGVGNVEVELIPYNYNPQTDSEDRIYKDTTDTNGNYLFEVDINSIYTVFAKDPSTGKRLLHFEQPVFLPNTNVGSDTLRSTGTIECLFSDSITESGYVYISGTPFHTDLEEGVVRIDGKFSVMIDSLPETEVPAVLMRTSSKSVVGNFVDVIATDTIPIGDTAILPFWEFKVLVGISEQTSQYYGSLDTVIGLVQKQVRTAMNKFNYPRVFNGVLNFVIDSVYEFTQSDSLEQATDWSWSDAHIRVLYDAYSTKTKGNWDSYYKTAVMVTDSLDSLFSSNRTDALVWFFGLARGCVGLSWMNVYDGYNPINGQDYLGVKSIMNIPYGETIWDDCSINIINYYGSQHYEGLVRDTRFVPDSIIVNSIDGQSGTPLIGAEISVYQVNIRSWAVESTSTVSGITDGSGELLLSLNPYDADDDGVMAALNCLVTSIYNGDTSYCWMPYNDAANSWMEDNNKPYKVIVTH